MTARHDSAAVAFGTTAASSRPALVLAAVLLAVWGALPARADETVDVRRQRIEQMSPEAKNDLRRHQDRFAAMDSLEQARLRQLASEIEQDPQAEQLRKIAQHYYDWVSRLPSEVREELMELPPPERIKRVKDLMDQERAKLSQRLLPADAEALRQWIRKYAEKNEKQIESELRKSAAREGLPKDTLPKEGGLNRLLQNSAQMTRPQWLQWLAVAHWQMAWATGNSPLSADDLAELHGKLSTEARQLMEGKTPAEQWQLLHHWVRQLAFQHFTGGGKGTSDEQLLSFFEHELSDAERETLFGLPPDEMQQRLTEWYNASKMRGMGLQPGLGMPRDFNSRANKRPSGSFDLPPHKNKGKRREGGPPPGPPPPDGPNLSPERP